jgi:hypothetical protein
MNDDRIVHLLIDDEIPWAPDVVCGEPMPLNVATIVAWRNHDVWNTGLIRCDRCGRGLMH